MGYSKRTQAFLGKFIPKMRDGGELPEYGNGGTINNILKGVAGVTQGFTALNDSYNKPKGPPDEEETPQDVMVNKNASEITNEEAFANYYRNQIANPMNIISNIQKGINPYNTPQPNEAGISELHQNVPMFDYMHITDSGLPTNRDDENMNQVINPGEGKSFPPSTGYGSTGEEPYTGNSLGKLGIEHTTVMKGMQPFKSNDIMVEGGIKEEGEFPPIKSGFGKFMNSAYAAPALLGVMGMTNNILENRETSRREKKFRDEDLLADNIFASSKSSRGDYTVNNGYFRPNQKTPVQYMEKGGETDKKKWVMQKMQDGGQSDPPNSNRVNRINIPLRQAFAESTWNPKAKSEAGARGLVQIMPNTEEELKRLKLVGKDFDPLDPVQAIKAQTAYMKNISEKEYLAKGSEEVQLAKFLFAYNAGPTKAKNVLTKLKEKGVDIYESLDWVDQINDESKGYINKITGKDEKFNSEYESSYNDPKYKNIVDLYQQEDDIINFDSSHKPSFIPRKPVKGFKEDSYIKFKNGGETDLPHFPKGGQPYSLKEYQEGGEAEGDPISQKPPVSHRDSVAHQADKILKYEQLKGGPKGTPLPSYADPKYKKMLMEGVLPEVNKIMPNASAIEKGEAMDFIFNAGFDKSSNKITRDPRAYALQEYYKKHDPSKLDKDGKWAGRKGTPYSFDEEYKNTIGKLSENDRRILMNKGRDWYYQNINNKSDGSPSDNYADTWYGRIWNTNDYSEFDSENPKFNPPEFKRGGETDGDKKPPVKYVQPGDPELDSTQVWDYSQLQREVEPAWSNVEFDSFSDEEKQKFNEGQAKLQQMASDLVKNNPNIDWVNPGMSPDIQHNTIEPIGQWNGYGTNNIYAEPYQRYEPRDQLPSFNEKNREYKEGGEYNLSQEEIDNLISQGYKVEYVKKKTLK